MVVILFVAGIVSVLLREYTDAGAIFAIVVLNAVLGFFQEHRAERAMAALKSLAVPVVRVRRDGRVLEIPSSHLVPGDVVLLDAGGHVPADGRLFETANLRIQEAALTGESEPAEKVTAAIGKNDLPLGDRSNMAFMGTTVVAGRGALVVTETGMRTELGRIADMLQTVRREPTPLQRRMEQLARGLAAAALAVVLVVFGLGILRGEPFRLMFLVAISMAVAAVPEGLPAVVTIALTLGARRMLARKALIRRLAAVETLGSVTCICSDKTGTLTQNRMTVARLDVGGRQFDIEDRARRSAAGLDAGASLLLAGGTLCNDSVLERDESDREKFSAVGDPTEAALVIAAADAGLDQAELGRTLPRVAELPFTSERKRMTTVHRLDATPGLGGRLAGALRAFVPGSEYFAFTKGAADVLLGLSAAVWDGGRIERLTDERRERISRSNDALAQDGMRVLGLAFRPVAAGVLPGDEQTLERDLVFVGVVGMIDPPRPEVKEAVATCRAAGIRPVMVTGDHPLTARHIAAELGMGEGGGLLTGRELARMSVAELEPVVERTTVYARVAPEHKLGIVQALQNKGHVVAMTGDGVNDAPALKKADIGVSMGITGTDVAKEAADMVLLDDNFATIVAAVREGRAIYDNIRKFIKYILSANSGEIWVMLIAPFLGMPLPLVPLQILWINLVTDGLPSLALSVEPAERDVMRRPPRNPRESIFGQGLGWYIIWVGLLMAVASLGMGFWAWRRGDPGWQTMVFTVVTMSQLFQCLAVRSSRDSTFTIGFHSNPALLGTFLFTLVLQLVVIYVPFLQGVFRTVPLSPRDLAICLGLSSTTFWAVELDKLFLRVRGRRRAPTAGR
jgi:Ca2+-transporting ATPase